MEAHPQISLLKIHSGAKHLERRCIRTYTDIRILREFIAEREGKVIAGCTKNDAVDHVARARVERANLRNIPSNAI